MSYQTLHSESFNSESLNNETIKLKSRGIKYIVNKEKGYVTAIETFIAYGQYNSYDFQTIGIARLNKDKDSFDENIGKKVARAKAEKQAFVTFRRFMQEELYTLAHAHCCLINTINKMNSLIKHQKEYLSTF